MKRRLLDLFCGAGGAAMGYHRAGFEVVGVDIKPQKHYPFEFHQADAMTYPLKGFDVIHASPPCQGYSGMNRKHYKQHPMLINVIRRRLSGYSYVIENVTGARAWMPKAVPICGSALGLSVWRHRLFESSSALFWTECLHYKTNIPVYGKLDGRRLWTRADGSELRAPKCLKQASQAMGIDWMTWDELREAIPPAYTEFIGKQLMEQL